MPPLPADFIHVRVCKPKCEKFLTQPYLQGHEENDGVERINFPIRPQGRGSEASGLAFLYRSQVSKCTRKLAVAGTATVLKEIFAAFLHACPVAPVAQRQCDTVLHIQPVQRCTAALKILLKRSHICVPSPGNIHAELQIAQRMARLLYEFLFAVPVCCNAPQLVHGLSAPDPSRPPPESR